MHPRKADNKTEQATIPVCSDGQWDNPFQNPHTQNYSIIYVLHGSGQQAYKIHLALLHTDLCVMFEPASKTFTYISTNSYD